MSDVKRFFVVLVAVCVLGLVPSVARAESIIERGGASHDYFLEVEPHAALTPFWPPRGTASAGFGAGALFAFNVAKKGFLNQVNDSFAVAVGLDYVRYFGGPAVAGDCVEWRGTGKERICVRTSASGGDAGYFFVPVVAQWNFYLVPEFSAFAEMGISSYFWSPRNSSYVGFGVVPTGGVGGRWHFSEPVSLTFRLSYPYTTVGLSFRF